MVDIYERVEDLCNTKFAYDEYAYKVKEELMDKFNSFCDERGIEFTWLSDSCIAVDSEDDCEALEEEISDMLDEVFDEFISNLAKEEDEYLKNGSDYENGIDYDYM